MSENWSTEELKASVLAYIEMQRAARSGAPVVKKEIYRRLAAHVGRSEGAWEYRMQNISYVLMLKGREWLQGLKPAKNVGANVAAEIESILAELENRPPDEAVEFEAKVQVALSKGNLPKPAGIAKPVAGSCKSTTFQRDPLVKAWVLEHANGKCEFCGQPAPFVTDLGQPFLEVHHVRPLAEGGSDTVENAVAVCPNCHCEFHHSRDRAACVERLYASVARLIAE